MVHCLMLRAPTSCVVDGRADEPGLMLNDH